MIKLMIFSRDSELYKAIELLEEIKGNYTVIYPQENIALEFCPALALEQINYSLLMANFKNEFVFAGVVDYYVQNEPLPLENENGKQDVFGNAYIMYASPCYANELKIRIIAHLSQDIGDLMPYINTYLKSCFYNHQNKTITYMDNHRMISLYNNKIAIAKANNINDVWHLINKIRNIVNTVNSQKDVIIPSFAMKKKPPVFEIYNVLPKTNCGHCPQKTCMSFAAALQNGSAKVLDCEPIFKGDYIYMGEKYLEMCGNLGLEIFN